MLILLIKKNNRQRRGLKLIGKSFICQAHTRQIAIKISSSRLYQGQIRTKKTKTKGPEGPVIMVEKKLIKLENNNPIWVGNFVNALSFLEENNYELYLKADGILYTNTDESETVMHLNSGRPIKDLRRIFEIEKHFHTKGTYRGLSESIEINVNDIKK